MKLSASLVTRSVVAVSVPSYAQKIASRVEPGQSYETVGGPRVRILQKSASPEGLNLRVRVGSEQKFLSSRQFASLEIVSPALKRLASFVHRIANANSDIDQYVKQAIIAAGLPVDPSMNWGSYLKRMYSQATSALTSDPTMVEEAIIEIIVAELYTKNLLSPNSPYAHFNPEHEKLEGKTLEKKVTAFLINIFKGRKEMAADIVRRAQGIGAQGNVGLQPTVSLDEPTTNQDGDDSSDSNFDALTKGEDNHDIEELEGRDEINAFLNAFVEDVVTRQRKTTAALMLAITKCYADGMDRLEIKDKVLADPKLIKLFNGKLTRDSYNDALQKWGKEMNTWASDPKNPWSDSTIGRMIARAAKQMSKDEEKAKAEKQKKTTSSLHLADFEQNGQQPEEQQQAPAPPPPPPVNPNVQQQNQVKQQNGLSMAQPANDADPNDQAQQPNQPKKTISPEIPGVNHTASEDVMSKQTSIREKDVVKTVKAKKEAAAPVVVDKFAKIRLIAKTEPQEMGLALGQLTASIKSIVAKLETLTANLDLAPAGKTASVREKIAARAKFARGLRRVAEENPEQVGEVVNDIYSELDSIVSEVENLADNLDIPLEVTEEADEDGFAPTDELPGEAFAADEADAAEADAVDEADAEEAVA